MKKYKRTTVHHVRPRSRGGSDEPENLRRWDGEFHRAYHFMFDNMTLEESIVFLTMVSVLSREWNNNKLYRLRESIKEMTENGQDVLAILASLYEGGKR